MSSFFQNINTHLPNYKKKSCQELIDIFNDKYINILENYHSINCVMKKYDVEQFDKFDFEKGYVIKEKGNIVFIKLLFSDINKWDKILSEIFNKEIIIFNDNLTKHKNYNSIYNEFKTNYKIKKSYINNILKNDKDFKIYNTKEYQDFYINKYLSISY